MNKINFDYHEAFSRNFGLVTEFEQRILKSKKIAIAGMGGVGGSHLQVLARMGIENFHIADMDHFELANFNRQAGAMMCNIGTDKVKAMKTSALEINPDANIKVFDKGVTEENLEEFLDGVDIYVDGLDFFVLDIRAKIFEKCRQKNIPAVTAGPIGVSTAYLVFDPKGMSFEEYFQFEGTDEVDRALHFLVGLTPALAQRDHIVDYDSMNFNKKKGASLAVSCYASSAVMGTEVLKLLLERGKTYYVPWALQFDMYNNKFKKTYNWLGNKNPFNKFKIKMVRKKVTEKIEKNTVFNKAYKSDLEQILDIARWAPSGDNAQPWDISIKSDNEFNLNIGSFKKDIYNLIDMPDLISVGMFLENASISAQEKGKSIKWNVRKNEVQVKCVNKKTVLKDHLFASIKKRSVNRFPYKLKPLSENVKHVLEMELDHDIKIQWFCSVAERFEIAKLLMLNTNIRLHIPEAYSVHKNMIDWSNENSVEGLPSKTLGNNALSLLAMKQAFTSKKVNAFLMKIWGATFPVEVELDLIPSLMCSGHFVMSFDPEKTPNPNKADYIRAGQSMQRFWLSLASHQMVLQPWYAPITFSRYIEEGVVFTKDKKLENKTHKLHDKFVKNILEPHDIKLKHVFFTGRVGYAKKTPQIRSVRKAIETALSD